MDSSLYILIAGQGPDAYGADAVHQQNGTEMILKRCKPDPQREILMLRLEYSSQANNSSLQFSSARPLTSISNEELKQRFDIDWPSNVEKERL